MEVDLDAVSLEMFKIYSTLHTPRLVYNAIMRTPGYFPLKLVIIGRQGTGKTAFAYYSAKTALGLMKCNDYGVGITDKEKCFNFLVDKYDLCLGRYCHRDKLDESLRGGMYITVEDLQKRLPLDVSTGAIKDYPVLFFDDAVVPGTYWHLGGPWRLTYQALREFERFYRDFANVLIITAPSSYHIDKAYKTHAAIITSDIMRRRSDNKLYNTFAKTVQRRVATANGIKMQWQVEYIDLVPHRAIYGLPQWLEEDLSARRYAVVNAALEKLRRAIEEQGDGVPKINPEILDNPPKRRGRPKKTTK